MITHAHDVSSPDMMHWIAAGRVQFEVHDCFTAQGEDKTGAVFILKKVL